MLYQISGYSMASVKIVLRKKLNKDGTMPLAIRIVKDRKQSFVHTGYSIKQTDWDEENARVKKSHPNSKRLNNFLLQKLADANDITIEAETKTEPSSVKSIKQKIKPTVSETFFAQANDYLKNLHAAGKYNQYTADKSRIGHFREFMNDADIAFSDITVGLLERFQTYLKSYHIGKTSKTSKIPKKPMGDRSIINHLVAIRSTFAHARKNKVITKDISPFGGDDGIKIKFPDSKKIGVLPEDVNSLEALELKDPRHDHARRLWLFSFYFAGMRVSDILRLRWSDFRNYRLHYSMGKNDKAGSLKVPEQAIKILKHYEQFKENENDLVFPELKGVDLEDKFVTQRTIAFKTSALDKILRLNVAPAAGINHKLTMHIARHTFGGLAGDTIPIQMLQKLYRHSNVSTTIGYQSNFTHKDADDALDAVIGKAKNQSNKPE